MAVRSPSRLAVSRHVYLRTQQRRLRHVRSIVLRNLTLPEDDFYLESPLSLAVHFTIHPPNSLETVLYESEPVMETYNPSWEAIHFTAPDHCKYAALSGFTIKVWISHYHGYKPSSKNSRVVLEKNVHLVDLAYLGTKVSKDGSCYPPSSLVVGMFEGYYTFPSVNGAITPPKVVHSMNDLLPPMSLLEVNKSELMDSYHHTTLKRIINRQEVLNSASSAAKEHREAVKNYKIKEETYFDHRRERERLAMQVKLLQQQLQDQLIMEKNEQRALFELRSQLDAREESLKSRLTELTEEKEQYIEDHKHHTKRKDRLTRFEKFRMLRERTMIHELGQTFFIMQAKDAFTICNIILPNSDQHDQPSIHDQLGVALGYVAQLVHHIATTLSAPLQYPLHLNGSKSSIYDYISDISAVQSNRDFPLFLRSSEKEVFMYAVYLLNKDICQLRQFTGLGVSKSLFRHTLPNLKYLIDKLTEPMVSHVVPQPELLLQSISVPAHMSTSTARELSSSPQQEAYPPSPQLIASEPLSLHQDNELLHQPRDSTSSPEPTSEPNSAQVQSPPLQFELNDNFLQQSRVNHASSSAYSIQQKPASVFPLLSPIHSEGSPVLLEEREFPPTLSHSHADLHKIEAHRVEYESSPACTGFGLAEEEEGAVGGGLSSDLILFEEMGNGGLSMNVRNGEAHSSCDYRASSCEPPVNPTPEDGGPAVLETTLEPGEVGDEQLSLVKEQQGSNEQGYSHSNEIPSPAEKSFNYHQQFPDSSKYLKPGLATPHMLGSTWEVEADPSPLTNVSVRKVSESPDRDSHFLEDFID